MSKIYDYVPYNKRAVYHMHFPPTFLGPSTAPTNRLFGQCHADYDDIKRLTEISRQITERTWVKKPDLFIIIANGGLPLGCSVIQRFTDDHTRASFRDTKPFHVFPGLSWTEKSSLAETTEDIFSTNFIFLLEKITKNKKEATIFFVDASRRGNAANRILNCIYNISDKMKDQTIKIKLELHIAIGLDDPKKPPQGHTTIGNYRGKKIQILLPKSKYGFRAHDGKSNCIRYESKKMCPIFDHLMIHYYPVVNLFTEDEEKLIGYERLSDALGIKQMVHNASLNVTLRNGLSNDVSGQDGVSRSLGNILCEKSPYFFKWAEENSRFSKKKIKSLMLTPNTKGIGRLISEGVYIEKNGPGSLVSELLALPRNLTPDEIYRSFESGEFSNSSQLQKKTITSFAKLSIDDKNKIAAWIVSRLSDGNPDIAKNEPAGSPIEKMIWWLSELVK